MTSCPQNLERFLADDVNDGERTEIERHVETCRRCQEQLEQLTAYEGANWPVLPVPWDDSQRPPEELALPRAGVPAIPGYEIVRELGHGGQSVVYLACHGRLKRQVALKVIRPGAETNHSDLARFRVEAEAMARLKHPNIIPIYAVGEHEGRTYFVMEYAAGGSLRDRLDDRPQPPDLPVRLILTLAHAMHYAHQRGVIHRDLTPGNVLLAAPAEPPAGDATDVTASDVPGLDGVPKVADFGLAKFLDERGLQTSVTLPGEALGTPRYMAPEQAAGRLSEIGTLTDVYSLGAILYRLLTGHAPFEGANKLEIIRKVQTELPAPPSTLQPSVPRDLELICLKCLEKEPGRRYASAKQLADELQRWLKGEPLRYTRPVGRLERTWRWCRRNPALTAAALLLLTLVGLSTWVAADKINVADTLGAILKERDDSRTKELALAERSRLLETIALFNGLVPVHAERRMWWFGHHLEVASELKAPDLERICRLNLAAWSAHVSALKHCWRADSEILALAYSPDGQFVVTGSKQGIAQVWSTATWKPLGAPLIHQDPVNAVAFSPDGQLIATGSGGGIGPGNKDAGARLWHTATGKMALPAPVHSGRSSRSAILALAFSPDGRTLITGSMDGNARLWDAATGKAGLVLNHQNSWINAVAFSPDGQTVLTGSGAPYLPGPGNARIWEAATGKHRLEFADRNGGVLAATFNPDGKLVLTASNDGAARMWETETGKPVGPPLQHETAVCAAVFSPDGRTILTGARDNTARLWEKETGIAIGPALPHAGAVRALAFSPDGKTFLTGSTDKVARLWQTAPGTRTRVLLKSEDPTQGFRLHSIALSGDGKLLVTGIGKYSPLDKKKWGEAQLWDAATGKALGPPMYHDDWVLRVALNLDSKMLATASIGTPGLAAQGDAHLWDPVTGNHVRSLRHPGWVTGLAFSPDGKRLLTGCTDNPYARLWDVVSGQLLRSFPHHATVTSVAFSPGGRQALTGSADGTAQLWDVDSGQPVFTEPLRHPDRIGAVAFSRDGKFLFTAIGNAEQHWGEVRRWETETGKPIGRALQHYSAVLALAPSPDGQLVLTGSADRKAYFWDVGTGTPIGPPLHHGKQVLAVAYSPAGNTAVTASLDGTAQVWQTPAPLEGKVEAIRAWIPVVTNLDLDHGQRPGVRVLNPESWQEHCRRLKSLGGPPAPERGRLAS
jgi:WD40 repeat protein/serine/threonine protein kinase